MKKGAASRIFCFQQLHILWVLTQNSPLGAALMPPTCTDTWTHRSHGGEDPSWFQWSLVAPRCPRTLLRKEQVRWGIREGKVPSVLLLFLVFIGMTMPCLGRVLRAVPSISHASPSLLGREERSGGCKEIPAVEMGSREQLPAVKPLARGSQLGEGWG